MILNNRHMNGQLNEINSYACLAFPTCKMMDRRVLDLDYIS